MNVKITMFNKRIEAIVKKKIKRLGHPFVTFPHKPPTCIPASPTYYKSLLIFFFNKLLLFYSISVGVCELSGKTLIANPLCPA